jgi:hypothetical protein
MNAVQQYKQWATRAGVAVGAVAFAWLVVDVIGQMFRQGQDAWAVGFCLGIYAALALIARGRRA